MNVIAAVESFREVAIAHPNAELDDIMGVLAKKGMRECATLSWKLKRLPCRWFDGDASRNQATDERSRDGKSATNGQETQEVASSG